MSNLSNGSNGSAPNSIVIQGPAGFRVQFPSTVTSTGSAIAPQDVITPSLVSAALFATHAAMVSLVKYKGARHAILGLCKGPSQGQTVQVVFQSAFVDHAQQEFILSANFREQLQSLLSIPSLIVTLEHIDSDDATKQPTWIPVDRFEQLSGIMQDLVLGLPSSVDEHRIFIGLPSGGLLAGGKRSAILSPVTSASATTNLKTWTEPSLQWIAVPLLAFHAFQYTIKSEHSYVPGHETPGSEIVRDLQFCYAYALKTIWENIETSTKDDVNHLVEVMGIKGDSLPVIVELSNLGLYVHGFSQKSSITTQLNKLLKA